MGDIFKACEEGNTSRLKQILEDKPGEVNKVKAFGHKWTPLHVAVKYGQLECVKILLDKGADPNRKDSGQTALQLAEINMDSKQWTAYPQEIVDLLKNRK